MKTIRYEDPSQFSNKTQSFLERNEAANNLILGITRRLVDKTDYQEIKPYLATVEDDEALLLVALQTPPNRLILYSEEDLPNEAFESIVSDLSSEEESIPRIVGPLKIVNRFKNVWQAKMKCESKVSTNLRCYILTKVEYIPSTPGIFRAGTEEDIDILKEWSRAFASVLNDNISLEKAAERTKVKIEKNDLYVWENNQIVSMAHKNRYLRNGVVVGNVITPPEHRRNGYAMACVAKLSQEILSSGYKFCSLFTDLSNPTSNSIYQKIGYKPVCDYIEYDFHKSSK